MQLIKGGSSHEIGKRDGMRFPVWHAGFTEHQIRDQRDFDSHTKYIDENPVKASLAEKSEEYPLGIWRRNGWRRIHGRSRSLRPKGGLRDDNFCVWAPIEKSGRNVNRSRAGVTAGLKARPFDLRPKAEH